MKSQQSFDLPKYLSKAIEHIVADSLRAVFDNPRETAFLTQFSAAAHKAAKTRQKYAAEGERIPPFLIASVTRECNLHCIGCFAHANNKCADGCAGAGAGSGSDAGVDSDKDAMDVINESAGSANSDRSAMPASRPMTPEDWDRVFDEAETIGVSFIFLVGGEPMLQRETIRRAGEHSRVLFPIITNGLFLDDDYLQLLDEHRNLLPVISLEGGEQSTDSRRGPGIYQLLQKAMQRLAQRGIPFGVSITATTENIEEITETAFLRGLYERGCKMVLFVEYAATGADDLRLEPTDESRARMEERLAAVREELDRMVILAFPGDEKAYGGCLAAGRGFFHISAEGDAEPCPFAPFSDCNVRDTSVREALRSRLFGRLEERDMLQEDHSGGCALNGKGAEIEKLIAAGLYEGASTER